MAEGGATVSVEARAKGLMRRKDFPAAIELLQQELEQDPSDGDLLELLGMSYFFSGSNEEARDSFKKLTRAEPMRTNAWVNLGAVLNKLGDHKHAADALRRALQRDRKCVIAYYNLGIAQKALGQNTMAISAYKEAVRHQPEFDDAQMNLGKIYLEMNNLGLAQKCFNAVLKQSPKNAKARALLDKIQQSQKQVRKSESPFGRLVDEQALAAAQVANTPRSIDAAQRNEERDLCRKLTKVIRANLKQMVPMLDVKLHGTLQKLSVGSLQGDTKSHDPALLAQLSETRQQLAELRNTASEACQEIRKHLE